LDFALGQGQVTQVCLPEANSLAAGHKSTERPAFKTIARRNQQSYELVEFVDCRSWFVQPQRGSCLDTRTLTFAVPAVAALLYLLG
jgi:hypothetical protein